MKKLMYAVGAALASPFALFAEESSGSDVVSHITAAQVGTLFESAQGSITDVVDKAWPVLGVMLLTGLTIWAVIAIVIICKRALNAGKGR